MFPAQGSNLSELLPLLQEASGVSAEGERIGHKSRAWSLSSVAVRNSRVSPGHTAWFPARSETGGRALVELSVSGHRPLPATFLFMQIRTCRSKVIFNRAPKESVQVSEQSQVINCYSWDQLISLVTISEMSCKMSADWSGSAGLVTWERALCWQGKAREPVSQTKAFLCSKNLQRSQPGLPFSGLLRVNCQVLHQDNLFVAHQCSSEEL